MRSKEREARRRKRPHRVPQDRDPLSAELRQVGEMIRSGSHDRALSLCNDLLSRGVLPAEQRWQAMALVADSEYRRGAYHQAADIYLRVAKASVRHPRLWLRPLLGYVQASLKSGHVEHAVTMAWHALSVAEQKHAAFEQQVSNANAALRARGVVSVPMLPPRKSVVATRLGYLFYHEGEPEQAQAFFEKAIDFNPRGATRARQGLAHVCLSQGDSAKALRMARESILHGRFRAKTISSWPIFIAATRQRG